MVSVQDAEKAMTEAASKGNKESIGDSVPRLFGIFLPLQAQREEEILKAAPVEHRYGPLDRQMLDCYVPQSSTDKSPVLVFVHGGGFVVGDKRLSPVVHANLGQFFSSRGFVTVIINYRLYGKHDAAFPSGGEDISLALQWIAANTDKLPSADLNNVFLCGNSAGGVHLATFLYGPDAIPQEATFKTADQIPGLRIKAAVLMSAPMHFSDPINDSRREVLDGYFGSAERSSRYDVIGLRKASKNNIPILVSWGELDPMDEIMKSIHDYLALWKNGGAPEGVDKPQEMVMKNQTHIVPPMSLGLGGSADQWGLDLIDWMKSMVAQSSRL